MRFVFLIITFFLFNCNSQENPRVENGILDIRSWDFENKHEIVLQGDWEFYWGMFLFPEDFNSNKNVSTSNSFSLNKNQVENPVFMELPRIWNKFQWKESKLPGHGFATFRMKILLNKSDNRKFGIYLRDQGHAYRLFINGKLVKESGKVGKNFYEMRPDIHPALIEFTLDSTEIELVFHVSNFHHRVGGMRFPVTFGEYDFIKNNREREFALDSFLYGGFFIIGIYHLGIYFFRRKNKTPLYFTFFCFSLLLYLMIVGERFLYFYFPNIWDWDTSYKIEFLSICGILISIFYFFNSIFPLEKPALVYIYRILISISIFYAILILFSGTKFFTELLFIIDFSVVFGGSFIIVNLLISIWNKKDGGMFFLVGFLVLFICAILDMLSSHSVIVLPKTLKYGLTTMVLLQAILLAKLFTGDFLKSEILSASLTKTNEAYSRFIPTEFLNLLDKKTILDINLGDHIQKEMTILFSDIRSFTSLSEKMTPEENFKFLNSYLNRIAPIIKNHRGFIDKYIGDAIMGLFPNNSDDAVLASIAMQREISEYNIIRSNYGFSTIKVGIGLHTGSLILGTIGHDERMEGTVISDAVNLASRLEGLTKHYGSNILISEDTFNLLEDPSKYDFRLLDNVLVKGKEEGIFVIEILDGFPDDLLEKFMETKKDFETGNLLYKQKVFDASIGYFKKVLEKNPADTATAFYLKRAEYYSIHGAPPDWDEGEIFLDK